MLRIPFSEYTYGYSVPIQTLENIEPREKITYYCGELGFDKSDAANTQRYAVSALFSVASALYAEGKIDLFQRRVRCFKSSREVRAFEYIALGK